MVANFKHSSKQERTGFALLMTLIVVSVLISIGLVVLDLSMKQVRLSSNARESEIAFHAANAGAECARYIRRIASTTIERGGPITPSCFSGTLTSNTNQEITTGVTGDGKVFRYDFALSWSTNNHCSQVTMIVASSTPQGTPTTINGLMTSGHPAYVPGYPEASRECGLGERCTILSVRGFNKPCGSTDGYGVVQREVLLQF